MATFKFRVWHALTRDIRRFQTISNAERYARRQVERSGGVYRLESTAEGSNGELIAVVQRDALDRVWTDIPEFQSAFL